MTAVDSANSLSISSFNCDNKTFSPSVGLKVSKFANLHSLQNQISTDNAVFVIDSEDNGDQKEKENDRDACKCRHIRSHLCQHHSSCNDNNYLVDNANQENKCLLVYTSATPSVNAPSLSSSTTSVSSQYNPNALDLTVAKNKYIATSPFKKRTKLPTVTKETANVTDALPILHQMVS